MMEEYARPPRSARTSRCICCNERGGLRWQLVETFPTRQYEPICAPCQLLQADDFTAAGAIAQASAIVHFAKREVRP